MGARQQLCAIGGVNWRERHEAIKEAVRRAVRVNLLRRCARERHDAAGAVHSSAAKRARLGHDLLHLGIEGRRRGLFGFGRASRQHRSLPVGPERHSGPL